MAPRPGPERAGTEDAKAAGAGKRKAPEQGLEQLRLAHTRRFVEYVQSLGLADEAQLGALASDVLGRIGAEAEVDDQPGPKKPRTAVGDQHTAAVELQPWIDRARTAMLRPGLGAATPSTAASWRQEAVARWGDRVPEAHRIASWEAYVKSRLPTVLPMSPLGIMQERYAYDMWRLLVACTLMTRISSERVKEGVIGSFFSRYPGPSRFLSRGADDSQCLQEILRPLGLVENRVKTIAAISTCFLEMPVFDCGHQKGVNKIAGCGPFAVDSLLIFCRGRILPQTSDDACMRYLEWRRSAPELSGQCEGPEPVSKLSDEGAQQASLLSFFKGGC